MRRARRAAPLAGVAAPRLGAWVTALLGIGIAASAPGLGAEPVPPVPARVPAFDGASIRQRYPADDALYLQRVELRARLMADFETYDTVEPVPGAAHPSRLDAATTRTGTIDPPALEAAAAYTAASPSTSLLVWRRGRVELERYFGERRREDTILGRSLAKPLAAIAVGRAIALGKIRSLDEPGAGFSYKKRSSTWSRC